MFLGKSSCDGVQFCDTLGGTILFNTCLGAGRIEEKSTRNPRLGCILASGEIRV
jgi:hypothetical protein